MAIADLPAGEELAGEDPDEPTAPDPVSPPRALRFNATTRDHDMDSDGRYIELHPVDAAVELALLMELGKIASAPATGQTFREIRNPYAADALQDATARARRALTRLIAAGDVTLAQVEIEPHPSGLAIRIDYVNERLRPREKRSARVPVG